MAVDRASTSGPGRLLAAPVPFLALALALGAMLMAAVPAGATLLDPGRGTVDTIAGPTYCDGPSTRDATSGATRALAVDPDGTVFVETGARADVDTIARIGAGVTELDTAQAFTPAPRGRPSSASRIVGDGAGGVFVAAGPKIERIDAGNSTSTIAGDPAARSGTLGPPGSGDGGPIETARFHSTRSMTGDPAGNLYVADLIDDGAGTVGIRFLNRGHSPVVIYPGTDQELTVAPGTIETIAGRPGRAGGGDGGPARRATLQGIPPSLALSGSLLYLGSYWAPPGGGRGVAGVRVINLGGAAANANGVVVAAGNIETVAGPVFAYLPGIAAAQDGSLLLADELHQVVRRIDRLGHRSILAGIENAGPEDGGFNGNDRPALGARLNRPFDVKVGPAGTVYIADQSNDQVRMVDPAGTIHAVRGSGIALSWSCARDQDQGRSADPLSPVADRAGNVYFALAGQDQIKSLDPQGVVRTVAHVSGILALAPDAGGRGLYVLATSRGARVAFLNLIADPVTVNGVTVPPGGVGPVAGTGEAGAAGDGGRAAAARLESAGGLAADSRGNVFIADAVNGRIRQVDPAGVISTFAGEGAAGSRGGCCRSPISLVTDAADDLYVADSTAASAPRLWFINRTDRPAVAHGRRAAPGAATVVAGDGMVGIDGEGGPGLDAQLLDVRGLAVDRAGNLYTGEIDPTYGSGYVRRLDSFGILTNLAGDGGSAFNGDGLKGRLTSLGQIRGLALDPCGNVMVADADHHRVRRLILAAPCAPGGRAGPRPPDPLGVRLAAFAAGLAVAGLAVRRLRAGARR